MQCNSTKVKYLNNSFCCSLEDRLELFANNKFDWQALAETANVAIAIFDNNGRIRYINSLMKTITGHTKAELMRNRDLLSQLKIFSKQVDWAVGNKAAIQREIGLITKSGDLRWLSCSIQTTDFNQQPAILMTAVDVTPYKQIQEQLQQTIEREKQRARCNLEFTSMIFHELRTPLNIISFASNLLEQYRDRWGKSRKQEYFDRIKRGIDTISLLIDEVSIIGKAEAQTQTIKFNPQRIEVQKFCQTLLEDFQLANSIEQQINFDLKSDCLAFLDKSILQLILTNLLENAIKYSPQGQAVDFTVTTSLDRVIFKIKDGGIGITPVDLPKLFEPFYRGNNVGELPGSGLGLAVVKRLVTLHGGEISVNSQVGVGTEFTVSLPKQN